MTTSDSRTPVRGKSNCIICKNGADAASEFEWFCEAVNAWLCETHCAEIQMKHYPDTRKKLAQLINYKGNDDGLLTICDGGPFGPAVIK